MRDDIANEYKSNSQKARIITENWFLENFKCPYCGMFLIQHGANNKCADFYCEKCKEEFELKSINGKFPKKKINGSEYNATVEKIRSGTGINWILLEHDNYIVKNLTFIPKYMIYDELIEPRKPLSNTARRAGWQGCRICISKIPSFGKIQYIENEKSVENKIIEYKLDKAEFFKNSDIKNKNWKLEILSIIDTLDGNMFTLKDLSKFILDLQEKHPNNKNIDAKVRQTLQYLRDDGFLEFLDKGLYMKKF